MRRISPFLVYGENIWWTQTETDYQFFDSDTDPEYQSEGPNLMHFSEHMLPDIFSRHNETWSTILSNESIIMPASSIKLYDRDGNFTGTRYYPPQPQRSEPTNSQHSNNTSPTCAQNGHEDDLMQIDYTTISPQAPSASLLATEGNQETTESPSTSGTTPQDQPVQTPSTTFSGLCYTTPHTNGKSLVPISLFSSTNLHIPSSDANVEPSNQCEPVSTEPEEIVSIDFTVDIDTPTIKTTHQTKTAKLLHHTLGDNSDITLLDNLRVTLKEKKQKKLKPSQHIVQQYNTVTAKLYLQVGSVKRETKRQVVDFEKAYNTQHGRFPDRSKNEDYNKLLRTYDNLKRLLQNWDSHVCL